MCFGSQVKSYSKFKSDEVKILENIIKMSIFDNPY